MKAILSVVIFICLFTSIGGTLIVGGFMILGFLSHERGIGYWDLEWYYHVGYFIYSILVLSLLAKGARFLSNFIVNLFK